MPHTLAPSGRRGFLKGAAAAACASLLPIVPHALAQTARIPMPRLPLPKLSPLDDPASKGFLIWNVAPIEYVAEEYLLSGTSPIWETTSILDTQGGGTASQAPFNYLQHTPNGQPRKVLGSGPYTTRIVVYRPRDMTKFNGVTVIEPMHSNAGGFLYVLNTISKFYSSRGMAVIALQNPNTFAASKKADATRYAALEMKDWTQFWGAVSQLGALVKSDASPIPAATRRLYMTGYSQTGMLTATFANFYHNQTRHPDGRPIYDGYLPHGNNFYIQPLDVPVIRVNSQGDFNYFTNPSYNPYARAPDSNDPWNRTRRYEVAGAIHAPLPVAEAGAAIPPVQRTELLQCFKDQYPADAKQHDMTFFRPVYEIALVHMEEWITANIPPPRAPWIEIAKNTSYAETDEHGNAVGGLRMPDILLPVAKYDVGEKACRLGGYMIPFATEKLRNLYGGKANYLKLYDRAADTLVDQRWMLRESAEQLKQHVRKSVPEF